MILNLRITVLIDDTASRAGLLTEHGLALWIEADGRRILFDTGQSDAFLRNARDLGIDLSAADTLVLSHGHYDHTGGIAALLECNPSVSIYCHGGIFAPRFSRRPDGTTKPIGIGPEASGALRKTGGAVHSVSGPVFLDKSIGITGPVPQATDFEDTGGAFFLDPEGERPDPIDDDMALWIKTAAGLVVVTGCCHSGIVNTARHIQSLTGTPGIHTIIGGLHLLNASAQRLKKTIAALNAIPSLQRLALCHCTGEDAIAAIQDSVDAETVRGGSGYELQI
jgi:7,8-dihydropterin-6-yl-methyl-4-(beta-D-ribofuranosyl)aminobenzene 5'-phosphate synthase